MKLFIEIGSSLRSGRQEQQLSIRDVAHRTKIQPHLLEALEEGVFTVFPSPCYLKSFAHQYANFLQLDLHDDLERISTRLALSNDDLMSKAEKAYPPLRERQRSDEKQFQVRAATLALQPLVVATLSVAFIASAIMAFQHLDQRLTLQPPRQQTPVAAVGEPPVTQGEFPPEVITNPLVQADLPSSSRGL